MNADPTPEREGLWRAVVEDVARELDVWARRLEEANPAGLRDTLRHWLANPDEAAAMLELAERWRGGTLESSDDH